MKIKTSKEFHELESKQHLLKKDSSESCKKSVWWEGYPTPMDAAEVEVDRRAEKRLMKTQK